MSMISLPILGERANFAASKDLDANASCSELVGPVTEMT
jgi:hypothetical protein